VLRFTHYLAEKVEYRCSLASGLGGGFEVPPTVTAPPAGPEGAPCTPAAGCCLLSAVCCLLSAVCCLLSAVCWLGPRPGCAPAGSGRQADRPPRAGPAAAGVEVEVEVTFEPGTVGEALRDTLLVSSPAAGEYTCPLLGRCQPPKPLGPILLAKAAGAVPFKNVFAQEAEFTYAVDNPAFVVKAGERLGAKRGTSIAVAYKGGGERSTGKLTVACPKMTGAQWVFYLQA
jgi:hypothetical protein